MLLSGESVTVGEVNYKRRVPTQPALIPHVRFFAIPHHLKLLREMLKDYSTGMLTFLIQFDHG